MIREKAKSTLTKAFGSGFMARDGINFAVSCPECDSTKSKKKFSVRLDDYRYHCWVCGIKGKNVWIYVKRKLNFSDIDETLLSRKPDAVVEEIVEKISLPRGFVPLFRESRDPDVKAVLNYVKKRGFTLSDVYRWRMLTTTSGKFRRRAIIPSFDEDGELNYFVGRSIDTGALKYLNARVPKSEVIFNEIDIDWKSPVVLVEGVFDAMKCPENTVPVLGSTVSVRSRLFKKLMKNQCETIVSFDPDLKEKAFLLANNLYEAGCKVKICFAPQNHDLGSLSKSQNLDIIKNAKIYTPYARLEHKINLIRSGTII